MHQHFPDQVTAGFPLRAILVPSVRPLQQESRIVETSRAGALAALAPSTMFQLRSADGDALGTMSRLLERVPSYGLEVGTDVGAIPGVIEDFLSGLRSY